MKMIYNFDTNLYARKLRAVGVPDDQVEVFIDLAQEAAPRDLVTQADLRATAAELRTEIAEVRTEIGDLRSEMAVNFKELYKHLWIMAAGIVTVTVALLKLIP